MLTILWKNKPSHYDTRMVTSVWFENSKVFYTIEGVHGVSETKTKLIDRIVNDEVYFEIRKPA